MRNGNRCWRSLIAISGVSAPLRFFLAWSESQQIEPAQWLPALKLSIHGLAGVAALVDQERVGDMAREIERLWDTDGPNTALTPLIQELSDTLMQSKLLHDSA